LEKFVIPFDKNVGLGQSHFVLEAGFDPSEMWVLPPYPNCTCSYFLSFFITLQALPTLVQPSLLLTVLAMFPFCQMFSFIKHFTFIFVSA